VNTREFLVARRNAEQPVFRKVLDALPGDQWAYRPHERSPSASALVWTMATEAESCCQLVREGHIDWHPLAPPDDPEETKAAHDRHYEELTGLVASMNDDAWLRRAPFRVNGETKMEMTAGDLLWFFFFDAIHHRGQLSTYIRPMGGKVPAIYGPSADDPG